METQRLHANYYLSLLQDAEGHLAGAEQLTAISQVEADFENVRAAWHWAVMQDEYGLIDRALQGLFCWFWLRRSRQQEGLALLNMAFQRWSPEGTAAERSVWGRITARRIEQQGPWLVAPAVVRERAARALAIAEEQKNEGESAFCHRVIGLTIVSEKRDGEREWNNLQLDKLSPQCSEATANSLQRTGTRHLLALYHYFVGAHGGPISGSSTAGIGGQPFEHCG